MPKQSGVVSSPPPPPPPPPSLRACLVWTVGSLDSREPASAHHNAGANIRARRTESRRDPSLEGCRSGGCSTTAPDFRATARAVRPSQSCDAGDPGEADDGRERGRWPEWASSCSPRVLGRYHRRAPEVSPKANNCSKVAPGAEIGDSAYLRSSPSSGQRRPNSLTMVDRRGRSGPMLAQSSSPPKHKNM